MIYTKQVHRFEWSWTWAGFYRLFIFFFIICLYLYYHWRSSYQEGRFFGSHSQV